jgi:glycosyltransferase involved in cell wall biosynthesis
MKKIKVIKFDNHQGGGTFIVAKYLLELLEEKGYEYAVTYIERKDIYLETKGRKELIKKFRLVPPFLQPYYQNLKLRKYIDEDDLLIVLHGTSLFLPRKNKKIVYIHHSNAYRYYDDSKWKKGYKKISNYIEMIILYFLEWLQNPDKVLFNSYYSKTRCKHYRAKNEIEILYPPSPFSGNINTEKKEFPIITLSRLHPEKNLGLLIEAAKEFPSLQFQINGFYAKSEYADDLIEKSKSLKNLKLCLNQKDSEVDAALYNAKYYLHTMKGEHFGIAVAQAAMNGCILILSNKGGLTEIAPKHSYNYRNKQELFEVLKKIQSGNTIKTDNEYTKSLETKFSVQTYKDSFNKLINNFL